VGELLARELGWEFHDLDQRVERETETTIPQIFSERGESAFRELESQALRRILTDLRGARSVVALGGGTLLLKENRDEVLKRGSLVYLEASFARIHERTQESPNERPLLNSNLADLFAARRTGYEVASLRVSTDEKSPEAVAKEIAQHVQAGSL